MALLKIGSANSRESVDFIDKSEIKKWSRARRSDCSPPK